jgi:glycerate kinase
VKIVVAPDSFKECLSALRVAEAIARGLRRADPEAEVVLVPMADGGEGTVDAVVEATGGRRLRTTVTGPLGDPVEATFGVTGDGATAVMEMAQASGLPLVPPQRRNPLVTTTYGTGELIGEALAEGVRTVIIGIGGSATVDGGAGMAQALGVKLTDASGRELGWGGGELGRLAHVDVGGLEERVLGVRFRVACDVTNPLLGERGAARVYGPQKGATPEMVAVLERDLTRFARIIARDLGVEVAKVPGAGAAGGLGAGLKAFLAAELVPGVEVVAEAVGLAEKMAGADLVITGEGKLDGQSAFGKTPVGVARLAKKEGIPVVALAGALGADVERVLAHGIDAYFGIADGPLRYEESLARAGELLASAAEQCLRLWLSGRGARPVGADDR